MHYGLLAKVFFYVSELACVAGYQRICIFPTYEKFVSILKEACNRSNFGWLIRQMSTNQKRGRRFVEGLCWALFSFRLSHRNVIYRAKRKQSLISGESVRLTIGLPVVRMDGRAVGRSGGGAVYGHVITKFSRMGRYTQLWFLWGYARAPVAHVEHGCKLVSIGLLLVWAPSGSSMSEKSHVSQPGTRFRTSGTPL